MSDQTSQKRAMSTGLNILPRLVGGTMPISGMLRGGSLFKPSYDPKKLLEVNGNYEGDTSMFGAHIRRPSPSSDGTTEEECELQYNNEDSPNLSYEQSLVGDGEETEKSFRFRTSGAANDSEDNYESQYVRDELHAGRQNAQSEAVSAVHVLWYCSLIRSISSKLEGLMDRLDSPKLEIPLLCIRLLGWGILYSLHFILIKVLRYGAWTRILRFAEIWLRGFCRRMLWNMSLTQCGNIALFLYISLAAPLLFLCAITGLLVAIFCYMEALVSRIRD